MPSGYKMVYIYDELGREVRYIEYDIADKIMTYQDKVRDLVMHFH